MPSEEPRQKTYLKKCPRNANGREWEQQVSFSPS